MFLISIDPDLNGGIALFTCDEKRIHLLDVKDIPSREIRCGKGKPRKVPDPTKILEICIPRVIPFKIIVENASASRGRDNLTQGTVSTFKYAYNAGSIQAVAMILADIHNGEFEVISPVKWTRVFRDKVPKGLSTYNRRKYTKDCVYNSISKVFGKEWVSGPRGGKIYGRSDAIGIGYAYWMLYIREESVNDQ